MKEYLPKRIAALQNVLKEEGLDAALIYDRENLIYFAGVTDLEGGVLCVPAEGEATLFCIWMEDAHMKEATGLPVKGYYFPKDSPSTMAAEWLKNLGIKNPKVGFTRYFISLKDYQCLMDSVPGTVIGDIATACYKLRSVKCAEEIERMEKAGKAVEAGMDAAVKAVKAGLPEYSILADAQYAMGKAGSEGSPFRMQVLTHSRQMQIHPYASSALLEDNAPVVIHLGATVDGYAAKMCRTVFLGTPPEECVNIYRVLKKAEETAVAKLRPGITCGELYDIVTEVVKEAGYEKYWVMEQIGYGVGIRQSEFYPVVAKGSSVKLEENMVIDLLLPTIYIPHIGGPRLTDTILITQNGGKYLTDYSRDVIKK